MTIPAGPAPHDVIGALSPESYMQTMRRAFSEHYRDGSDEWSRDPAMRTFPAFVERHAGLSPDARVLDIGCGSGNDARYLSRRYRAVVGIDICPHADWEGLAGDHCNLRFRRCDLLSFASEDREGFDLILDNGSFHHQHPALYRAYLGAVASLLRPAGRFALSTFKQPACPGHVDARGRLHRVFEDEELSTLLVDAGLRSMAGRDVFRPTKGNFYRYTVCVRSSAGDPRDAPGRDRA